MEKLLTTRVVGLELTQPEGVGSETTSDQIDTAFGDIIGFSLSAPYTNDKLALMKITIEQSDLKPVSGASVDNFIPIAGRFFYRFSKPLRAGQKVNVTIESLTADSAAAKPIIVNWHHNQNNETED